MRKLIISALFFVLTGASVAFAADDTAPIGSLDYPLVSRYRVLAISELTQDMVEEFFLGERGPSFVLLCEEGTILPFKLSLKGEFLEAEDSSSKIKVMKTCYINRVGHTFLFTTDFQAWKNFQEFFTGTTGVSLEIVDGLPTIELNIELKQR